MFLIHKPNAETVARFISTQRDLPLTYSAAGACSFRVAPAAEYVKDKSRCVEMKRATVSAFGLWIRNIAKVDF